MIELSIPFKPVGTVLHNSYNQLKETGRSVDGYPLSDHFFRVWKDHGPVTAFKHLVRQHDRNQLGNQELPATVRAFGTLIGTALLYTPACAMGNMVLETMYEGANEDGDGSSSTHETGGTGVSVTR